MPAPRRALPPLAQAQWSLLVQGMDLHLDSARKMLERFRFVPDARLDDVMVSYATDGGGVGPHFDSYDVFLLQIHGPRRWRIGRQKDLIRISFYIGSRPSGLESDVHHMPPMLSRRA